MIAHFAFSVSELDRSFIAGFLEGEATFAIFEMNGGQSLSCGVSVNVRDDDQELLEYLHALTGFGGLSRVPARATSRPQVRWTINAQEQCLELAALIGDDGFHGRRAAELAIWRQAVSIWTQTRGDLRRARLRKLKDRLQRSRRFGATVRTARPFANRRASLGYISGLVCAEGSFGLSDARPRFSMHLRSDDRPLLELLATTTGLGNIYDHRPAAPLNPSSIWVITAGDELAVLVDLLVAGGLYGRKRLEMDAWAVAVDERRAAKRRGRRVDKEIVRAAAQRLADIRQYLPAVERELFSLPGKDWRADAIAALSRWSQEHDGSLSSVAYSRWRPDGFPTRNTIARQFGGWQAALAAAGLAERIATAPETVAARASGGALRREQRRQAQRARVLRAVELFESQHGRLPRAMEFFRWRLTAAPDTPTQGTVYHLFPGGWQEVLDACRAHDSGRQLLSNPPQRRAHGFEPRAA